MYDQIASNKRRSALLIGVFVALIVLLGWVFGELTGYGYVAPLLASGVAAAMAWGSYRYSDRIVLSMSRARPADPRADQYLVNTVEGLAIAAGVPKPAAYVVEDPAPNAFATGRDPEHAAIAVTTGLVEKLDRLELEGVVAHELAHVRNYDVRLQTLTAVLAGTVVLMADWMRRWMWWGGRGRRRGESGAGIAFLVLGLVSAILAPLAALAIHSAISRRREFLADADGALLTRYPPGLAGALRKIAEDPNRLRVANKATAPLWIANPLRDYGGRVNAMFETHPPIEERIRRLEAM
ncbi:MAG: M48 family metallopeptidase [Coriobacteriia bacterium]|nr:M48 family metallopeptidase [Coriobacteriia bacterium]